MHPPMNRTLGRRTCWGTAVGRRVGTRWTPEHLTHTFVPTSLPTVTFLPTNLPSHQPNHPRWGSATGRRRTSTPTGSMAGLSGPQGAAAGAWRRRGETCASSPPTTLAARSRWWGWAGSSPPGGPSTPSSRPSRWKSPTWQAKAMARSTKWPFLFWMPIARFLANLSRSGMMWESDRYVKKRRCHPNSLIAIFTTGSYLKASTTSVHAVWRGSKVFEVLPCWDGRRPGGGVVGAENVGSLSQDCLPSVFLTLSWPL